MARAFYVYIMTNYLGTTLYTGGTNDIMRRVAEHKAAERSFTARYKVTRLVYVEETSDVRDAIQREKQIKGWTRKKKLDLIGTLNPRWRDLSDDWAENSEPDSPRQDSSHTQNDVS